MARVYDNWERLVRATLRREQLWHTGPGYDRTSSGIAGAVPDSLQRTTNVNAILQAADEIQEEDPNVSRIHYGLVNIRGEFTYTSSICYEQPSDRGQLVCSPSITNAS